MYPARRVPFWVTLPSQSRPPELLLARAAVCRFFRRRPPPPLLPPLPRHDAPRLVNRVDGARRRLHVSCSRVPFWVTLPPNPVPIFFSRVASGAVAAAFWPPSPRGPHPSSSSLRSFLSLESQVDSQLSHSFNIFFHFVHAHSQQFFSLPSTKNEVLLRSSCSRARGCGGGR